MEQQLKQKTSKGNNFKLWKSINSYLKNNESITKFFLVLGNYFDELFEKEKSVESIFFYSDYLLDSSTLIHNISKKNINFFKNDSIKSQIIFHNLSEEDKKTVIYVFNMLYKNNAYISDFKIKKIDENNIILNNTNKSININLCIIFFDTEKYYKIDDQLNSFIDNEDIKIKFQETSNIYIMGNNLNFSEMDNDDFTDLYDTLTCEKILVKKYNDTIVPIYDIRDDECPISMVTKSQLFLKFDCGHELSSDIASSLIRTGKRECPYCRQPLEFKVNNHLEVLTDWLPDLDILEDVSYEILQKIIIPEKSENTKNPIIDMINYYTKFNKHAAYDIYSDIESDSERDSERDYGLPGYIDLSDDTSSVSSLDTSPSNSDIEDFI